MNRRSFIRNSSILGASLVVFPNSFFGRNKTKTITLPEANTQLRHGLYNDEQKIELGFIKELERTIFYKNGMHAGNEDLNLISFEIEKQVFCISKINNEVNINELSLSPQGSETLLAKPSISIELIKEANKTNCLNKSILIPISSSNEAIVADNEEIELNPKLEYIKISYYGKT